MSLVRIDKFLCDMQCGTRSQVKELIKKGNVTVNGTIIKKPETKVDNLQDIVELRGKRIEYVEFEYYMLNKPAGYISATEDKKDKTVLELIDSKKRKDLFPLGRLDKDTEGLLIITNDGEMCHNLLSPKKHIPKTYYAFTEGVIKPEAISLFAEGLTLLDGTKVKPAILKIVSFDENTSTIELTIYEGKFHQVKRMVEAVGAKVTYLKRLSMGKLKLDENLKPGEYRKLTTSEVALLNEREDA